MDQPETLLLDMAAWLPQELMDTDEASDDEDDDAAAADGDEAMTLLQLAHVSRWLLCDRHVQVLLKYVGYEGLRPCHITPCDSCCSTVLTLLAVSSVAAFAPPPLAGMCQ
jgi:hypothetical protein